VVRNGRAVPRSVMTSAGAIEVHAPRVNDKRIDEATGERKKFSSAILPAWCHRPPMITDVLPLLYLHGLSGGDLVPALEQFLGSSAGLSASTTTRPTEVWQGEQKAFAAGISRGSTTRTCGRTVFTSTSDSADDRGVDQRDREQHPGGAGHALAQPGRDATSVGEIARLGMPGEGRGAEGHHRLRAEDHDADADPQAGARS